MAEFEIADEDVVAWKIVALIIACTVAVVIYSGVFIAGRIVPRSNIFSPLLTIGGGSGVFASVVYAIYQGAELERKHGDMF